MLPLFAHLVSSHLRLIRSWNKRQIQAEGGVLTFGWYIFHVGNVTLSLSVLKLAPLSFLIALPSVFPLMNPLNGVCPSLPWALGTYLKTGGIWFVETTTCLEACLTGPLIIAYSTFTLHYSCCFTSSCLGITLELFAVFGSTLPVEEIMEGIVSLSAVPSSKNLESEKCDSTFVNGLTSPLIFFWPPQ